MHQIPLEVLKIHVNYHVIKNAEVPNQFNLMFDFDYDHTENTEGQARKKFRYYR